MFEPGTVVYGFAKTIRSPKYKYGISIYRDEKVQLLIHFTTTKPRAGVPNEHIHHGMVKDATGNVMSYVFEPDVEIGTTPQGKRFHFPRRTIMQFDYGYLCAEDLKLQEQFDNLSIKCRLDSKEYINLVYAMYKSKRTPNVYKPYLEQVLIKYA